jgi:hypothetical protein
MQWVQDTTTTDSSPCSPHTAASALPSSDAARCSLHAQLPQWHTAHSSTTSDSVSTLSSLNGILHSSITSDSVSTSSLNGILHSSTTSDSNQYTCAALTGHSAASLTATDDAPETQLLARGVCTWAGHTTEQLVRDGQPTCSRCWRGMYLGFAASCRRIRSAGSIPSARKAARYACR